MKMLVIFFFLLTVAPVLLEDTVITHPPSDTVGCLGGISIFTCGTNRSDLFKISWTIEGNTEWNEEERGTTIDLHSESAVTVSRLSITGLPINNGTIIGCIVVVSSPITTKSMLATFTVHEIPPVKDLKILDIHLEYPEELVTLAWNKSSCLPAEYVYDVTVHNGTGMIHTNTTDLQLSLKLSPCYNYTINVMIIGFTFQSQYSSSVISVEKSITEYPARDVIISNFHIEFKTSRISFVNFDFQILDLTCNVVFLYQHIAALSPPNIELQDPDKEIDVSDKVNRTTGFGQLSVGPFYQRFIGRLSMSTEKPVKYDNELSHMYKEFSTFHVQSLYVDQLRNGSVNVTCTFAKGSLADGCAVNFSLVLHAPSKIPHHSDVAVHSNSTFSVIIMREPKNAGTAAKIMIISEGEYYISAHDYIDEHRNDDSACSLIHKFSFSATLSVEPLSPSGSKTRATASTIVSDIYSSTKSPPAFDSGKSNQDLTVIVSFSLGLIFLILIITVVCMFVFIYKRYHAKSLMQIAQQEATNLQKSRAQPSLYTELPVLTGIAIRNDPKDPYHLSRQEFLHQCHTSPVSVALTSENSNIAALTMKTPEDDEDVCRERSSLKEEIYFQLNSTNQTDSRMLLNSKYINIDFPKQQLWPPLRDSKPVCYATLIHNDDERVKEHQQAVKTMNTDNSTLVEYAWSEHHHIAWEDATVLDQHLFLHPWYVKESWYISNIPETLNGKKGLLPETYLSLPSTNLKITPTDHHHHVQLSGHVTQVSEPEECRFQAPKDNS